MANMHKHPVRGLRGVDKALWDDFERATGEVGSDRSAVLKRFMEWFCGHPDAEVPERPSKG